MLYEVITHDETGTDQTDTENFVNFPLLMDEIHLDPFSTGIGNRNLPKSRRRGLERGRIVETGRHSELLARDGAYAKLYHIQYATQRAAA